MKLRSLREFGDVSPQWVQPDFLDRSYELRACDDVVATLRWKTPSSSLATGETAEGRWTLKRTGFPRPRVTARVVGSDTHAAIVTLQWSGNGDVQLADGREFLWTRVSFWYSAWAFANTIGQFLLVYKPKFITPGWEAEIEIVPQALALPELSLLTLLGWYLMVQINEEMVHQLRPVALPADHCGIAVLLARSEGQWESAATANELKETAQ